MKSVAGKRERYAQVTCRSVPSSRSLLVAVALLGLGGVPPAAGFTSCPGDCDGDGRVVVAELVRGVSIALGREVASVCPALDGDGNDRVTVDELVTSISNALNGCAAGQRRPWMFTDVTSEAGLAYRHGYFGSRPDSTMPVANMIGGVAVGDYDGDGWVDIYALGGEVGPNRLFRSRGDGRFEDMAEAAGVALRLQRNAGATFADIDGDGRLDLFVTGVEGALVRLFRNRGDGTFEDITAAAGLTQLTGDVFSSSFGDYDRDGDLDLFVGRWGASAPAQGIIEHLWRNNGDGTFTPASRPAGLQDIGLEDAGSGTRFSWVFGGNFADLNGDGWPDLLVTGDYRTSQVFLNRGDGSFREITTAVISDDNGMGSAVGDYDNDGDLDWFVSSIYRAPGQPGAAAMTGNRLYRNRGDGSFEDATDLAGVRQGYWGWAACFADFDNDGHLDLFHVNGFGYLDNVPQGTWNPTWADFHHDPAVLFVANGNGSFAERAAEVGLDDTGQGRGVSCFDYDHDGDIDVFISNNGQSPRLYRNDLSGEAHFLTVKLRGPTPNVDGVGARVIVSTGAASQVREVRAGTNYLSQNPDVAHFGLGSADVVDHVRVRWPDGGETVLNDVEVDQTLTIHRSVQGAETGSQRVRRLPRRPIR